MKIRSEWPISRLRNICSCLAKYNLQHSLSCKKCGFVSLRHNHLRKITAKLIDQECYGIRIEAAFQIITDKEFDSRSMIVWDEARMGISTRGFSTKYQTKYIDVKVFDPNAKRYESKSLQQYYRTNEMEKKQNYNKRNSPGWKWKLTPLVSLINGGIG